MFDFSSLKIDKNYVLDTHNNRAYNKVILNYYKKFYNETLEDTKLKKYYLSPARYSSIENCNKYWCIDKYDYLGIKDLVSTTLCKDKFCNNCKKVLQACRMSKYIPQIEPYKDNLYHLVLTLPNVNSLDLKDTIKNMSRAFKELISYIRVRSDKYYLECFNFKSLGYKGAIRSLEITYNQDSYHPHYHCAIVFENLNLDKHIKNNYSIDYIKNRGDVLFSDFEIIIQKIWYLLLNKIKVNDENIKNLSLGYSCKCDKFYDDDYMELFKYMTKGTDEHDNIMNYSNFKTLYLSTRYTKQIQSYGIFYNLTDDNVYEELEKIYVGIKEYLNDNDCCDNITQEPFELLNDNKYILISRKKIYNYLKNL